MGSVLEDI